MKKDKYVVITTYLDGNVGVFSFGKDKEWAERCYQSFIGDNVTLYKIITKSDVSIYLQPTKTRKEEK